VKALALLVVVTCAGCLLPSPPEPPRYFSPSEATPRPPVASPAAPGARLAIVRSPLHLREQMTWRRSQVEYGFYEQRRWTELPGSYVEKALAHELFVVQRISTAAGPDAPVVTVDLNAFEEALAPVHEARVAFTVTVAEPRCVRLRRSLSAASPLDGDDPVAVARGIGAALDDVVREAGVAVREALARPCGR
jgi:ABC-type uncharacterized transport system auxiliary subunit